MRYEIDILKIKTKLLPLSYQNSQSQVKNRNNKSSETIYVASFYELFRGRQWPSDKGR
jgi:hypothetical protein